MDFISTPVKYLEGTQTLARNLTDRIRMIDNLVELIVFTPRGTFEADPDFGFEYWNHEYANVRQRDFNSGQTSTDKSGSGLYDEVTRLECQNSIADSLNTYEPQLKQVNVSIELHSVNDDPSMRNSNSRHKVTVFVNGVLEDGLGTLTQYNKSLSFMMEPTVKRI